MPQRESMVATTADFPARLIAKLREFEAVVSEAILGKYDVVRVFLRRRWRVRACLLKMFPAWPIPVWLSRWHDPFRAVSSPATYQRHAAARRVSC